MGINTAVLKYDTAPAPLAGNYSVFLTGAGHLQVPLPVTGFTGRFFTMFNIQSGYDNTTIFDVRSTSPIAVHAGLQIRNGTGLRMQNNAGGQSSSVTSWTTGQTYYFWMNYTASGGGIAGTTYGYLSTTPTKPGSPTMSITNGTATGEVNAMRFANSANHRVILDNIIVDMTKEIGSNPF